MTRPVALRRLAPLALLALLPVGAAAQAAPRKDARLVLMLTVDQMRGDYLDRFKADLTGGFARLATQGIVFTDGRQDHAMTETAPGHSTILSGRSPSHTGIVSNTRGVPDASYPLLESTGTGASPAKFQGTTLADWMLARDPATRILSVSRKDRGAILPIGRSAADVFWWSAGKFTTSKWYRDSLPAWVRTVNARNPGQVLAGATWTPLLPAERYTEAEGPPTQLQRRDDRFPHRMPTDPEQAARAMEVFPWMDSLTLATALEGVKALQIGQRGDGKPDLLAISLSTLDVVGHNFGPDSREVHDHVVRLDRWLGAFLTELEKIVPADKVIIALTADHGVTALPETPGAGGKPVGGRAAFVEIGSAAARALENHFRTDFDIEFENGLLTADIAALKARGVNVDSLAESLAKQARSLDGVAAVYTPASLAAAPASEEGARLWKRTIPATQGWLIAGVAKPGWIWTNRPGWATHGTTNAPDMHVPIVFLAKGLAPARVARTATTEDIAPTLAALLGVKPTEPVDGSALPEVVGR